MTGFDAADALGVQGGAFGRGLGGPPVVAVPSTGNAAELEAALATRSNIRVLDPLDIVIFLAFITRPLEMPEYDVPACSGINSGNSWRCYPFRCKMQCLISDWMIYATALTHLDLEAVPGGKEIPSLILVIDEIHQ
jgi:hypothetical protein